MAVIGLGLQVLGIALILVGVWKAAGDLGAPARWRRRALLTVAAFWAVARDVWNRRVRGKQPGAAAAGVIAATAHAHAAGFDATLGPDWENQSTDERVEVLRRQIDALTGRVDEDREATSSRIEGVQEHISELESAVDERLRRHDARDETILGWELVGGITSMVGTILAYLGLPL